MNTFQRLICTSAAFACLLAAQDDPPDRVARLSYTYGTVSFQPAGEDDWFPASFNRPLTTGDHVFADPSATGELEIGTGRLLLGSQTALDILNLDDSNVQLRLTEGTLLVRLHALGDQESFEVDTPNLAFTLLRPGFYRIQVRPNEATTLVTVRAGDGELNGPDQAFTVHAGQFVQVSGDNQPNYQTFGLPATDRLDDFSEQREQREAQLISARYCSHDMIGYQDLDRYGSWRDAPDYGMVWVPNAMPAGWAPYHYGHWVWVDPWGWTWVDDAPWGFAPFHYGRWAYVGSSWAWIPGPVTERPVYAPALVAWVGGSGFAAGVAWFPLGPHEVYQPAYHYSPAYLTRVNVTNTVIVNRVNITNVNITNVTYINRNAPGAIMAVQRDAFAGARPVQSARLDVRPDMVRSASVMATVGVAPTRASLVRAPASGANIARPPAAIASRAVIARRTPPPPPVPFVQRQAALSSNGGRPLDPNQVRQIRQAQPPPQRPAVRTVQARPVAPAPPPARSAAPAPQPREAFPARERPPIPGEQPRQSFPPQQARPTPVPQPRETFPPRQERPSTPAPQPRESFSPRQQPSQTAPAPRNVPPVERTAPPPPERTAPRTAQPPAAQRPNTPPRSTGAPPPRNDKGGEQKEKDKKSDK